MPKLWTDTIEAHRRSVRDATLDAAAAMVGERGLAGMTMSEVAERAGIGRATLYKYFPDVEAILLAWHERQVTNHLQHLGGIATGPGSAAERLEAVLEAYASLSREGHGTELATMLHRGDHVGRARHSMHGFIRDLLAEGASAGCVRNDVAPDELASYCLHALSAAGQLGSKAAVRRLVRVTLAGLRHSA
jgi:AcrR family transcriptional regulator